MAKQTPRKARFNMRIHGDLLSWAKEYALTKNTNLTQLIIDYLTSLKSGDSNE